MFVLMIARGFPTSRNPQWGCFEKDQAEALVKYGHKVVVMSVDARLERHRGRLGMHHFENAEVSYYNYVMLPGILFSKVIGVDYYRKHIKFHYFEKIYKRVVSEHGTPDIIYSQFFFNTIAGVQLKEKYRVPVVAIEHLARFNESKLTKETEEGATYAFAGADSLIAVSDSLARNLEKRFHKKCFVVHNMFGKEFDTNAVGNKNVIQSKQLVFCSAASLVYRKGFDILINAFVKLNLPKESWKLNIIGWGEEKERLENLVKDNHLQNNICFLGKRNKDQIVNELRKSNVFALASRSETFGIVYIEAMSQGLPVIGTVCGGPEEFVNEKNGILVPADDVDATASAIKRMIETYSQYDRNQIAEDCKKRFSPEAIAGKLTDVFETVLKKQKQ